MRYSLRSSLGNFRAAIFKVYKSHLIIIVLELLLVILDLVQNGEAHIAYLHVLVVGFRSDVGFKFRVYDRVDERVGSRITCLIAAGVLAADFDERVDDPENVQSRFLIFYLNVDAALLQHLLLQP